jgi:polyisoprenoid-binding protein YceI
MHSEISFKVKHLVITTVTGKFKNFSGKVVTESDDFSNAQIEFSADVNSIDTGVEGRDGHLKSAEFFDAAAFPEISFKSTSFTRQGDNYVLNGDLTIRDVTRNISLDVEYLGTSKDPFYGKTKAGFEINGKILRKDFGLQWDVLTETGGAVVSNEVKLHLNIQVDRVDL